LVDTKGNICGIRNLTYLSSGGKIERDDMSVAAYWSDDTLGTKAVVKDTKYTLTDVYCQYFM
jgi:hypothetical protein